MNTHLYIWELSKEEQLKMYKRIKKALIENGVFTYDNLYDAMCERVKNIIHLFNE